MGPPERIIAGVVLCERLAVGMYGAVHRAQRDGQRHLRALVVDPRLLAEPEFHRELMETRQADKVIALQSDQIVPTLAIESEGPDVVVLTHGVGRYVTVQDMLASARARGFKIERSVVAAVALAAGEALAAAHQAQVVHGAVHPRSVLVDEEGAVRLTDFGVGRALTSAVAQGGDSQLWRGLAGFLAPELAIGAMPGPEADVFALGALVYVMLTGDAPPGALGTTAAVERVVTRALDTEANHRYRHPGELVTALRAALSTDGWAVASPAEIIAAAGLQNETTGIDSDTEDLLAALGSAAPAPVRPSMDLRAEVVAARGVRSSGLSGVEAVGGLDALLADLGEGDANGDPIDQDEPPPSVSSRDSLRSGRGRAHDASPALGSPRLSSPRSAGTPRSSLPALDRDSGRDSGRDPGRDSGRDSGRSSAIRPGGGTGRSAAIGPSSNPPSTMSSSYDVTPLPPPSPQSSMLGPLPVAPGKRPPAAGLDASLDDALGGLEDADETGERSVGATTGATAGATSGATEDAAMDALSDLRDPTGVSSPSATASAVAKSAKVAPVARAAKAAPARRPASDDSVTQLHPPSRGRAAPAMVELPDLPVPSLRRSPLWSVLWIGILVAAGVGTFLVYSSQKAERAADEERRQQEREAAAEMSARLSDNLPDPGGIRLSSDPSEATGWLLLGRTPFDSLPLSSNNVHQVRVELERYRTRELVIDGAQWKGIAGDKRAEVSTELERATKTTAPLSARVAEPPAGTGLAPGAGKIRFESRPSGAAVWLYIGVTGSIQFTGVAGQPYELRALKDGYLPGFARVSSDDWRAIVNGAPASGPIDSVEKKTAIEVHIPLTPDPDAPAAGSTPARRKGG